MTVVSASKLVNDFANCSEHTCSAGELVADTTINNIPGKTLMWLHNKFTFSRKGTQILSRFMVMLTSCNFMNREIQVAINSTLVCRGSQIKGQDPEIYNYCYNDETSSTSQRRKRMQSLKHVWSWCIKIVETNGTLNTNNTLNLRGHLYQDHVSISEN